MLGYISIAYLHLQFLDLEFLYIVIQLKRFLLVD